MAGPRPQRGATLLELGIVLALVAIFVTIATLRIWELRLAAERVSVDHTVGAIRIALGNETARRAIGSGVAAIARLDRTNPVQLLDKPPSNYIGEVENGTAVMSEGYSWYFDRSARELVYRLGNPGILAVPADELRFQVRFDFEDMDRDGQFNAANDRPLRIDLEAVRPYRWQVEDNDE